MISIRILIASLLISILLTYVVKKLAEKLSFYDVPHTRLKTHDKPTPYAGSSLWVSFMIVLLGLRIFTSFETGTLRQLRGLVYGGTLMFGLGLLDDKYDLDFKIKLLVQIAGALILAYFDITIELFNSNILNIGVSVFWVIFIVNAVNIIDVLDGLSVGVSTIAAAGFFAVTLPVEKIYVNLAALALFGVLLGFWFYNKPPAKVFMGDAGSLFTGFVLAALSMGADYSKVSIIGLFAPFLILGIPIYDTVVVSIFRLKNKQSIFLGSQDHFALRLSKAGMSAWQIDIISYWISIILTFSAVLITVVPQVYGFMIISAVFMSGLIGIGFLNSIDIEET
ncbi:MAG: MraY family glycosyltransferase [Elusimicrobiota bacterium]